MIYFRGGPRFIFAGVGAYIFVLRRCKGGLDKSCKFRARNENHF